MGKPLRVRVPPWAQVRNLQAVSVRLASLGGQLALNFQGKNELAILKMEQQNNTLSQLVISVAKRPTIITVFCIIGFIGTPFVFGGLLIPSARTFLIQQYGLLFVPITILSSLLGLIGLIGCWKMRKWGVYFYTAMAVISIGYGLVVGIPGILGYILPLVILGVGFANLKKMG
ncbi:MAG: hypothetical protein HY609_02315 [Deltaproteobacteria bacterium]|nr:hypothetical protein [Deltaproteobacteria bacterium]MBI4223743.1 hypothetical protein [Deltaproteobacteria bacterium]